MSIFLYTDNPSKSLKIEKVVEFLKSFNLEVKHKGDLHQFLNLSEKEFDEYKTVLNLSRVGDIEKPIDDLNNKGFEREYFQTGKDVQRYLYDANWIQRFLFKFFYSKLDNKVDDLHIIYTDKLFGTFGSRRYHARVVLAGQPSLISTSGLIEAPARPREYYFSKANFIQTGRDVKDLDEIYKDRFLDYDDKKITTIISAYTLQPILYYYSGQEFCENRNCSLFNSHWQEEVLNIQLESTVCEMCGKEIAKIK